MPKKIATARAWLWTPLAALVLATAATAQGKLETAAAPPPESLSPEVRALLAEGSFSVALDGAELGRFWFGRDIPFDAGAQEFGVHFNGLKSGQLIGAAELLKPWSDYKGEAVRPGVYTLRYAVQPADGNHTGVSSYRDFLLLLPAAEDTDPGREFPTEELNRLSAEASGAAIHPAVMALFPIWDEIAQPALVKNELEQWTLAVKLGGQTYGLVVQGHGEL